MDTFVLHLEIADFLVAVTEHLHPHLRDRPFVIAPVGADRARVYAASPMARIMGVYRGMFLKDAQKRSRELWVQPMDERLYAAIQRELVDVLAQYSPVLEPWRHGHVYIEIVQRRLTLPRIRDMAYQVQKDVLMRLTLKPAVGIGINKLISRAASRRAARHSEILWVPPGHERPFIAPFEVGFLPHVDQRIRGVLHNVNIRQVRELAQLTRGQLQQLFGPVGWRLYDEARGIDPSPVIPPEKRPGLYEEWRFATETNDADLIDSAAARLVGRLARRLRERGLRAGRIAMVATYADGRFFSSRRHLAPPSQLEEELMGPVRHLLERLLARRVALRRLGLRVLHLQQAVQLDLFAPETPPRPERLAQALDRIRARYGEEAILFGKEARLTGRSAS